MKNLNWLNTFNQRYKESAVKFVLQLSLKFIYFQYYDSKINTVIHTWSRKFETIAASALFYKNNSLEIEMKTCHKQTIYDKVYTKA